MLDQHEPAVFLQDQSLDAVPPVTAEEEQSPMLRGSETVMQVYEC